MHSWQSMLSHESKKKKRKQYTTFSLSWAITASKNKTNNYSANDVMTLCHNYPFCLAKAYTTLLYNQTFFSLYKMDAFGLIFIRPKRRHPILSSVT